MWAFQWEQTRSPSVFWSAALPAAIPQSQMTMPSPASDNAPPSKLPAPAWKEFARAPLVPVTLAATAGLIADRYSPVPLPVSLFAPAVGLVGWLAARVRVPTSAAVWLWLAAASLAAAHHHVHRHLFAADDIGYLAPDHPAPAKLRG